MAQLSGQSGREELAMRYLLRTLSEQEGELVEERYFSDDAEFEEMEIAEEELIDRYVRGELSQSDKAAFEKTLAAVPGLKERVHFARVFANKLGATQTPLPQASGIREQDAEKVTWWNRYFGASSEPRSARLLFAFGVLLVLLGGVTLLVGWLQIRRQSTQLAAQQAALEQRQRELDKQAAELKAHADELAKGGQQLAPETPISSPSPQDATSPAIVSLILSPGASRSTKQSNTIRIRAGTSEVQLTLKLRDTDYPSYRATITKADRTQVFSKVDLRPRVTNNGALLIFRVPVQHLSPADYIVTVYGGPPNAANESVDDYLFSVVK